MKRFSSVFFVSMFMLLVTENASAATFVTGHKYRFSSNVQLTQCDALGAAVVPAAHAVMQYHWQFIIVGHTNGGDSIIHVLPFPKNAANTTAYVTGGTGDIYYLIPGATFNSITEKSESKSSLVVGSVTVPAKLRFGGGSVADNNLRYFNFEGDISLGVTAGWRYKFDNNIALDVLGSFVISSTSVDDSTTNGAIASKTTVATFTPDLGVLVETSKIQFGVFSGIDFLGGRINTEWVYRNKVWLGIGIGVNIFQLTGPSTPNNPNK